MDGEPARQPPEGDHGQPEENPLAFGTACPSPLALPHLPRQKRNAHAGEEEIQEKGVIDSEKLGFGDALGGGGIRQKVEHRKALTHDNRRADEGRQEGEPLSEASSPLNIDKPGGLLP